MSSYFDPDDAGEILRASGLSSYDDLFVDVPEKCLSLMDSPEQEETAQERINLSNRAASVSDEDGPVYLGAGCYDHMVPSSVDRLVSQIEFNRMNASGRAEISEELQRAILGFQRIARRLTGMESANVSLYRRGVNALAHSCLIAVEAASRKLILAPETLRPERLSLLKPFFRAGGCELRAIPSRNGITDLDVLRQTLSDEGERVAATIVPYPNFYGNLERIGQISEATRGAGAFMIMTVDPVALATLRSPADWGASLVACDVHTTPIHTEDGDVRLGFVAASRRFLAAAPDNLATSVVDSSGDLTYCLSRDFGRVPVQRGARGCVVRARGALRTLVHLAYADPQELRRAANTSRRVAQYAREELAKAGFEFHSDAPYLREFAVKIDNPRGMLNYLERWGIVGGYEIKDGLILAFTEKRSLEEVDELVYFMREYRDRARSDDDPKSR